MGQAQKEKRSNTYSERSERHLRAHAQKHQRGATASRRAPELTTAAAADKSEGLHRPPQWAVSKSPSVQEPRRSCPGDTISEK